MCNDEGLGLPDCIKKSFKAGQTTIAEKWHLYKLKTKSCRRMSMYHAIVDFMVKSWLQIDDEHRKRRDSVGVFQYIQETARQMGEDREQYLRDFDSIFGRLQTVRKDLERNLLKKFQKSIDRRNQSK